VCRVIIVLVPPPPPHTHTHSHPHTHAHSASIRQFTHTPHTHTPAHSPTNHNRYLSFYLTFLDTQIFTSLMDEQGFGHGSEHSGRSISCGAAHSLSILLCHGVAHSLSILLCHVPLLSIVSCANRHHQLHPSLFRELFSSGHPVLSRVTPPRPPPPPPPTHTHIHTVISRASAPSRGCPSPVPSLHSRPQVKPSVRT
jgi:hypothetical protein